MELRRASISFLLEHFILRERWVHTRLEVRTERSRAPLPVFLVAAGCKTESSTTRIWYSHNLLILLRFPQLHLYSSACVHTHVCVCWVLCSFTSCVGSCGHHHKVQGYHQHKDPSGCPFIDPPTPLLLTSLKMELPLTQHSEKKGG